MPKPARSAILTLRVPSELDRRIERAARQKRRTKSAVLREALEGAFGGGRPPDDPARSRKSERDALEFIDASADDEGWR